MKDQLIIHSQFITLSELGGREGWDFWPQNNLLLFEIERVFNKHFHTVLENEFFVFHDFLTTNYSHMISA